MSRHFEWRLPTPRNMSWWLISALLLGTPMAVAQTKLGELLDAGGSPLSMEQFREEVVGRTVVGPTPAGGTVELMYAANGIVAGTGSLMRSVYASTAPVRGEWKFDERGKVCVSMIIAGHPAAPAFAGQVVLPSRCQTWFRHAGQYFIADSDSDRAAKVFRRTLKQ